MRTPRRYSEILLVAGAGLTIAACGGEAGNHGTQCPSLGALERCACADNTVGTMTCADNGYWSVCDCSTPYQPGTGGVGGATVEAAGGAAPGIGGLPAAGVGGTGVAGASGPGGAEGSGGPVSPGGASNTGGNPGSGGDPGVDGDSGVGGNVGVAGGQGVGGEAGTGGTTGEPCTVGTWPAADPAAAGPFATVTEENVGPTSSADGTQFTLFRPADLEESGLCHPIVTWGNGTSSPTSFYAIFLEHLASHGFVVIASNSGNVQQGNPPPMLLGVTWLLDENDDPGSEMYQRLDPDHVGATGHSQGGYATSEVGTDSHIHTTAPICGAIGSASLTGPALILCGGQDVNVPCGDHPLGAFNGTSNVPVMLANSHGADHANWITMFGDSLSDIEVATTAWMRIQLMGDNDLRSWFYGASCALCDRDDWTVQRKLMD
jgi:hypothetical protein